MRSTAGRSISGGTISGNTVKSTNKKDSSRGYIAIRGGVITIRCGDEPIQFVTDCTIENAKITFALNKE